MCKTLNGDIYGKTARRRNYLILRLDSFISDCAAIYDPSILTIEHVLPQTVDEKTQWFTFWPKKEDRDNWVHKIANLVPLALKTNIAAQNYDFNIKKNVYFGGKKGISSYALTTQVLNTVSWTREVVEKRQEELLKVFKNKWDLN